MDALTALAVEDSRLAEDLQRRLDLLAERFLDRLSRQKLRVLDHYLRSAYTHDADVVEVKGTLPAAALHMIAKFSARITVIARLQGELADSRPEIEDGRSHISSEYMVLMSPYQNRMFDVGATTNFDGLERRLDRTQTERREPFALSIDELGAISFAVSDQSTRVYVPNALQDQPTLEFFDLSRVAGSSECRLAYHTSVLYEALDPHHEELRVGLANLAKTQDPRDWLSQLAEAFESTRLNARERAVLDTALNLPWENVPAPPSSDVLVLPPAITNGATLRYVAADQALPYVYNAILAERASGRETVAKILEDLWSKGSTYLHELSDVQKKVMRLTDREEAPLGERPSYPIFFASLTSYSNEKLERALERQARLLTVINRFAGPRLALQYRIFTSPTRAGNLAPSVEVLCTVNECSELEAASLRDSFGELVHATFVGLYGLTFQVGEALDNDWSSIYADQAMYRARIVPAKADNAAIQISSFPDWAYVVDYICSMERPVSLVMSVSADSSEGYEVQHRPSQDDSRRHIDATNFGAMLDRISSRLGLQGQSVKLDIEISSNDPIPTPFLDLVCAEIGPMRQFTYEELDLETITPLRLSIVDALRVFHPPFGSWYGQGQRWLPLDLASPLDEFPQLGLPLGTATTRHAKANVKIPVRIPDQDRLRHVYVVGKTGSGKTNLLRGMVTAELSNPSAGLAVIDPHGDLASHVLNILPTARFADLQVVDLSDPDLTPVINPLLINSGDPLSRSRLTQEILGLLKTRIFHEWSGPRFDEIVRLLLDTMLDGGYPAVPSLVDASLLLTDESVQRHVRQSIEDPDLKARWGFHDRLKGGKEYYDLLDWAVSKLDDLQHDDTLRSILGGERNTIDIESVARDNGVLIVSIPESVVGKDTAQLIGSLVLLQLKAALFRRVPGANEPFFLYVDEFQKFAGIGFEELLAEARKFGVGLVMAHQNIEQLRAFSSFTGFSSHALVNSILGNVGTMAVFPISSQDAEVLSPQLGVSADEIARIPRFEAVLRATVEGHQVPAFTLATEYAEPGFDPRRTDDLREYLVTQGRMVRRDQVAREIDARRQRLRPVGKQTSSVRRDEAPDNPWTEPSTSGGFLDEWLAKRRNVQHLASEDSDSVSLPVAERRDEEHAVAPARSIAAPLDGGGSSERSWAQVIGPVTRLEDVSRYLSRSISRLKADGARGRLMVLETRDGTQVVPTSHFQDGSLVPGLTEVYGAMSAAPFSRWTQAAWLATPIPLLGGRSMIDSLRAGADLGLIVAAASAYSERAV